MPEHCESRAGSQRSHGGASLRTTPRRSDVITPRSGSDDSRTTRERTMSRVAITGIGIIAPAAIGTDAFRAMLRGGHTAIAPIDRFDTAGLRSHRAALVAGFQARDFIGPMKLRRM